MFWALYNPSIKTKLKSSAGTFSSGRFFSEPVNFHFLHLVIDFLIVAAASNRVFISASMLRSDSQPSKLLDLLSS